MCAYRGRSGGAGMVLVDFCRPSGAGDMQRRGPVADPSTSSLRLRSGRARLAKIWRPSGTSGWRMLPFVGVVIVVESFGDGRRLQRELVQIIHDDLVAGWFAQIGGGLCRDHYWSDVAGDFCPLPVGAGARRGGGGTLRAAGLVEAVASRGAIACWDGSSVPEWEQIQTNA